VLRPVPRSRSHRPNWGHCCPLALPCLARHTSLRLCPWCRATEEEAGLNRPTPIGTWDGSLPPTKPAAASSASSEAVKVRISSSALLEVGRLVVHDIHSSYEFASLSRGSEGDNGAGTGFTESRPPSLPGRSASIAGMTFLDTLDVPL
jgi:hypothetical protein